MRQYTEQPYGESGATRRSLSRSSKRSIRVAAILALSSGLVGCGGTADVTVTAGPDGCVPFSQPQNLDQLGAVVTGNRQVAGFIGGDVGADVTLSDGRRLWVFGDTLRRADYSGARYVRNSMLVFSSGCIQVATRDDRGAMIPDRQDGVGYWPMSVIDERRGDHDVVSVMAQRVKGKMQTGQFVNLGPAVAQFRVDDGKMPVLMSVRDLGPDSPSRKRPTWGAATHVASDGWIYIYGTANPEKDMVFGFSLSVARVKPDDLLDQGRWGYWDGATWQSDPAKAKELIKAQGGVSQTLSVFEKGGRWYAVSKRDEFLGKDLVIWSAPSPSGPFVASGPLAHIPSDTAAGTFRYMPLAHPELPAPEGKLVISVSRNTDDLSTIESKPELYRPEFVMVALPK